MNTSTMIWVYYMETLRSMESQLPPMYISHNHKRYPNHMTRPKRQWTAELSMIPQDCIYRAFVLTLAHNLGSNWNDSNLSANK